MDGPPAGYQPPLLVYVVEWLDDREPGEWAIKQLGAFTSESEATALQDRLTAEGWSRLRMNLLPVHTTVTDWEYDR